MIGFLIETRDLRRALRQLKKVKNKLEHREELHRKMRTYQRARWRENLYNEGAIYGPWQELTDTTNIVRQKRGFREGHPILFEAPGGGQAPRSMPKYLRRARPRRGGLLHAWVKENILADRFFDYGGINSTIWRFTATGQSDGSYAVYHDQGYTTGATSMIPLKGVPARTVFDINDEDEQKFENQLEAYVDKTLRLVFT